jgi:putative ABC transport system ATP-binding protein
MIVTLESVVKNYPLGKVVYQALRGISLKISKGEFMALAGPSGSGKTTALNLIGCIDKPTSGRVLIEDTDVGGLSSDKLAELRAEKIGFVFQQFNLLPVLTAVENVEYPLLNRRIPAGQRRRRAMDALDAVGLSRVASHKPLEMSGGQQQRVAVARAIVGEPLLVLADEPTANLDHATGEEIIALMKKINQQRQTTFVFSTHDSKIMEQAGRVVRIWDGEIRS